VNFAACLYGCKLQLSKYNISNTSYVGFDNIDVGIISFAWHFMLYIYEM